MEFGVGESAVAQASRRVTRSLASPGDLAEKVERVKGELGLSAV